MTLLRYPDVQIADQRCRGRLHFELLQRIRSTLVDGERVARDLLDWHDLR
ncbi:MAG TPA: hypothetical protein VKB35_08390 [Ktedonobacteraceae bacterium]|nr:hypothetical protein [Ktedonobacteraceae bacterium]